VKKILIPDLFFNFQFIFSFFIFHSSLFVVSLQKIPNS